MAAKSPTIEPERLHFKTLIALNPNHFGSFRQSGALAKGAGVAAFADAADVAAGNTSYEAIGCVGYCPDLALLEATVLIKRSYGYSGNLCTSGSTEFVRFYVDFGAGWTDAGLGALQAHDIPDGHDCARAATKPLSYAVSVPFDPARHACWSPQLPRVRAILSWEWMPPAGQPDWRPPWGDVVERHIQIAARNRIPIFELLKDAQVKLPLAIDHLELFEIELPEPPQPDAPQLAAYYANLPAASAVPAHRFAFTELTALADAPLVADPKTLLTNAAIYKEAGIDLAAALKALGSGDGNLTYEQLHCVALDYNREWAVANFEIKRPNGYSGNSCSAGSDEHVAFWIDWNDTCRWTYLGTVTQRVHDYAVPAGGLHYWVGLPARISEHRRHCSEPKIGRLRAVLSWNTPPSTTDPDAVPYWGNRLDTHFEVRPGVPLSDLPLIDTLGGVSLLYIQTGSSGMTVPSGLFAETGAPTDPWVTTRQCAFGGDVYATAEAPASFAAAGYQYRLMVRPDGTSGSGVPVLGSFAVTKTMALGGGTSFRAPAPDGWTPYLDPNFNIYDNIGRWSTAVLSAAERDVRWEIRLERRDGAATPNGMTAWYKLQLDNTNPVATIQIDSGGVVENCNDFDQGETITGHFTAYDPNGHFGVWTLDTTPNSLGPPDPVATPALLASSATTTIPPGHGWQLSPTLTLQPCGYVVTVRAWDNTIVNSNPWTHNYFETDTGFCLRKAP
jgi:hypothetical protein